MPSITLSWILPKEPSTSNAASRRPCTLPDPPVTPFTVARVGNQRALNGSMSRTLINKIVAPGSNRALTSRPQRRICKFLVQGDCHVHHLPLRQEIVKTIDNFPKARNILGNWFAFSLRAALQFR